MAENFNSSAIIFLIYRQLKGLSGVILESITEYEMIVNNVS